MLMNDRMDESLVLLSYLMRWDTTQIKFHDTTERVQKKKSFNCKDGPCRDAIMSCNLVDQRLYDHYRPVFDQLVAQVPSFDDKLASFRSAWNSKADGPWLRKYPTNCRGNMEDGDPKWVANHQCGKARRPHRQRRR